MGLKSILLVTGKHYQESKKMIPSNLPVHMLMPALLANKLMVFASRRMLILGILLEGCIM